MVHTFHNLPVAELTTTNHMIVKNVVATQVIAIARVNALVTAVHGIGPPAGIPILWPMAAFPEVLSTRIIILHAVPLMSVIVKSVVATT